MSWCSTGHFTKALMICICTKIISRPCSQRQWTNPKNVHQSSMFRSGIPQTWLFNVAVPCGLNVNLRDSRLNSFLTNDPEYWCFQQEQQFDLRAGCWWPDQPYRKEVTAKSWIRIVCADLRILRLCPWKIAWNLLGETKDGSQQCTALHCRKHCIWRLFGKKGSLFVSRWFIMQQKLQQTLWCFCIANCTEK